MQILVLNCGSSSLRFELCSFSGSLGARAWERLAKGNIANVGRGGASLRFSADGHEEVRTVEELRDHRLATRRAIEWLRSISLLGEGGPDGIGHRIVHGGRHLFAPVVIEDQVIREITAAGELAPLHNHAALEAIGAARELMGDAVPMVAVFDTAFHRSLPEHAARYAIPLDTADEHGIRRYGFHGLAHRYMAERCAELTGEPVEHLRLITLQLGGGSSATAVSGGRSVDTSMGFTPLEGLVMGTRSGDIDPSVVRYLCDRRRMTPGEVEAWLNHHSGLLGVSGASGDVRELLKLESEGSGPAALALDMFCCRVRKCVGAYLAVLGGARAIVFGGGIGENSAEIRARVCRGMEWCGLGIDEARNRGLAGQEREISAGGSQVRTYVIPVDEEILIARDTVECLLARRGGSAHHE